MAAVNLRHALRSLRSTPVFSVTVVLTLTLGLGAAGAMFAAALLL